MAGFGISEESFLCIKVVVVITSTVEYLYNIGKAKNNYVKRIFSADDLCENLNLTDFETKQIEKKKKNDHTNPTLHPDNRA